MATGGKAWTYRFDHVAPLGPAKGYAHHGADVPFIFTTAFRERRFWPVFDLQQRRTMTIDSEFAIVDDPDGDERDIWHGIM